MQVRALEEATTRWLAGDLSAHATNRQTQHLRKSATGHVRDKPQRLKTEAGKRLKASGSSVFSG